MDNIFLHNIEIIFVYIRSDINKESNKEMSSLIIRALETSMSNSIFCQNVEKFDTFVYGQLDKNDSNSVILTGKESDCNILIKMIQYFQDLLVAAKYELAYELADIIHAFPNIIMNDCKKSGKQFWKIYLLPFRKKYNNNFFDDFKSAIL